MAAALNRALADALRDDETVLVFGEDVAALGGVFRVTDGLAATFGEARVFDTPLAESGIVGTAIGMAMNGLRPVVEMQFDAFAYPAFEQITSHLAKLRNRTRGRVSLPIVIRIPYGGGIGGGRAPLRLVRGLLHPYRGTAGRHPGHAQRRLRAAAAGHRLPRSRHLPGAQTPLLVEGDHGPGPHGLGHRPGLRAPARL
jgi:hypothetical protein